MKYMFVIIAAMFFSSVLNAQVRVNFNIGGIPSWGHYGYNSHRVIVYHRLPVRYRVIYRDHNYDDRGPGYYGNQNNYGYDNYPLQKHDNGKHKGWYKGNNGNSYDNDRGNNNGYYKDNDNDNDNGYYNGNDNGNGNYNNNNDDNGYYNGNNEAPDKYKYK